MAKLFNLKLFQIFSQACDGFNDFKWKDGSSFNGWIYRIATNEVNQFFRKQKRYKLIIDDKNSKFILSDDNEAVEEIKKSVERDENLRTINNGLAKLSIDFQNVIRLRYFEEMPYEEIAKILNKNESTIRVYAKRAKEKLKEAISSEEK